MNARDITDATEWDALLATQPQAHPLQTWGWGEVKRTAGWGAKRIAVTEADGTLRAAAQVLVRRVPRLPLSVTYIPRGPVIDPQDGAGLAELMAAVDRYSRSIGAIFCKVDPAWFAGTPHVLTSAKFIPSGQTIQVTDSYTIDLKQSEEDLLAHMRGKTRQHLRNAQKEGVQIVRDTTGEWLNTCYQIYLETASRAHFGLHPAAYYEHIYRTYRAEQQYLYVAFVAEVPMAFLWMACFGQFAVEFYGGVSDAGQKSLANTLLKWHAIREMKNAGYALYDLNGRVTQGIGQFKTGFGPEASSWVGPFDRVYHPLMYQGWTRALPLARRMIAPNSGTGNGVE
ncbi:MAG: peptidoglycan bridge formation glycyltransferase FemA/FemB family protein [Ktedonobacterales bacterium]|nr:peptidoglycan bridge formation glycyltransferase FemA/FemB family protein [Ktedonobacterales bacterium]